jgi:hypothetical protein
MCADLRCSVLCLPSTLGGGHVVLLLAATPLVGLLSVEVLGSELDGGTVDMHRGDRIVAHRR